MKDLTDNEKVTNLDYLVQLSKGDKGFVKQMIRIFLEENPKEVDNLGTSIASRNYEKMRASAHKLKSSIPFVGLNRLIEEELYDIEQNAMSRPDMSKIEEEFSKIRKVCEKARTELDVLDA